MADLKGDDLIRAANIDFKDYEDTVQSACAARIEADYIITRNIKDFNRSKVTAIKPSEFFDQMSDA